MKIDRLLGITVYLLNRGKVDAKTLAARFEVSRRTIERDMETLCRAGIPVVSSCGAFGGYEILDTFRMERQTAGDSDYSSIVTALKGLLTAYDNPDAALALEKILALRGGETRPQHMILDFGVLREDERINGLLSLLDRAIGLKRTVFFRYAAANGAPHDREVEPVALVYRWYAWYLFAFSPQSGDYRLYKLLRMDCARITDRTFTRSDKDAEALLRAHDGADTRRMLDIRLRCRAETRAYTEEYLRGEVEREEENGDFILRLRLPEDEHFWFGALLALGGRAEVLEPEALRRRLAAKAQEILTLYEKRRQDDVGIPVV